MTDLHPDFFHQEARKCIFRIKAGKTWGENGENYTVVKFNQKL